MDKRIYKYPLNAIGSQQVMIPKGAEILTIQNQAEIACLWALVDTDQAPELRTIEIFGTGQKVPMVAAYERKYISTFQIDGGKFVFHAFERIDS